MNLKKKLGLRIKELRIKNNMTQAELAERTGIAAKHQSYIETGKTYPSAKLIESYADIFNIDVGDLLTISHIKDRNSLIKDIYQMLNKADDVSIVTAYKILNSILN